MDLEDGSYKVTAVVETLFCESEEEFSGDSESSTGSTSNEVHSHTDADKVNSMEPLPELLEVQVSRRSGCCSCHAKCLGVFSSNGWTNDKHVSYLNSMEEAFIKKLYGRKYCAVDICGEQPSQQEKTLDNSSKVFRSWLEKARSSRSSYSCLQKMPCRDGRLVEFNKQGTMKELTHPEKLDDFVALHSKT